MPTTGDLINLNKLVLTDTFNTWLNRTNQIVDTINPLQVYDVDVGAGSTAVETGAGLAKYTGEVAGNYNGVITVGLNPGPGVGYESISGASRTVVDFSKFSTYNRVLTGEGASGDGRRVASDDEFIVNDISDTTTSSAGTAKKVLARNILPPEVAMDLLTISGNVIIKGNLSTFGANSFIASNDLQIEDKQIELAFQQAIPLGMTGVTSGSFPLTGGQTAYYFVNASTITHAFYGHLQSFTAAAVGPTGTLVIGSLFGSLNDVNNSYGPEDFGATGYISLSSTGSTRYLYNSKGAIFNSFLNDQNLDEAGIVVKGSDSDKTWLWIYNDNDTGVIYNSWLANTNIGVDGNTNSIISRVYRSYGYTGVNNSEFIFAAENGKNAQIYLAETNTQTVPLTFTGGSWRIERDRTSNYLIFSVGATGISNSIENFLITPGASGQTFSGVPVNNYAKNFNADLLDGAHASITAAPYTIPIADSTGRINSDFVTSDSVRRRYVQAGHGLTFGVAVRVIPSTGGFTAAVATNAEFGEAIGIVGAVHSANEFTVVHQGRIENINGSLMTLEGSAFVTGNVYFLGASASNRGKLIADPDYAAATRLVTGQIRKPLLLALSATQGYVLDYTGSLVPSSASTDMVYLKGLLPVGTVQAYSGNLANLASEWLVCNGYRYRALDYPELYNTIRTTYFADLIVTASNVPSVSNGTATVSGGVRNIQIFDSYTITKNGITNSINVISVNSSAGTIEFQSDQTIAVDTLAYRMNPSINSSGEFIFFVPDLRARTLVGGTTGSNEYNTGVGFNPYVLGQVGGEEAISLNYTNLPPHNHTLSRDFGSLNSGSVGYVKDVAASGAVSGSGAAFSIRNPYLTIHYIIRAKAETEATILTGHNHDDRYHRLNDNMKITDNGNYRGVPSIYGATGFNVYADQGLLGRTAYILSCFVPTTPFTGGLGNDSRTKTHIIGDLTIWGTGITALNGVTGVHRPAFSFTTHGSGLVIEGGTGGMPAPYITFYTDGAGNQGSVRGLTAPIANDYAVNKYYSDTSDKTVVADLAGYGDWQIVHSAGDLPATGFGTGESQRGNRILKTSWYQNALSNNNSKLQTEVYGDFTVWGDGLPGNPNVTGHNTVTFAVDPLKSEVTIEGRTDNPAKPAPTLTFWNSQTNSIFPAIGKINGLTAPTRGDQAANKDYVDSSRTKIYWIVGIGGPYGPDDKPDTWVQQFPNGNQNIRNQAHPPPLAFGWHNHHEGGITNTHRTFCFFNSLAGGSKPRLENSENYRKRQGYAIKDVTAATTVTDGVVYSVDTNVITAPATAGSNDEKSRTGGPSMAWDYLSSIRIEGGVYSIYVKGAARKSTYGQVGFQVVGYSGDNTTPISQCLINNAWYDGGEQVIDGNGFVKIGSTGKFTVQMKFDAIAIDDGKFGTNEQNRNIINYIMLTRIGNL